MLYDPARHEPLIERHWDERHARDAIARIVADTEARFSADAYWPMHPRDVEGSDDGPAWPLYHGACGVIWALTYLEGMGAATLARNYLPFVEPVRVRNAQWLAAFGPNASSYLMGDVPNLLLEYGIRPRSATLDRLETLIESNVDHPARELMWGSPGTMLAALFLHDRTGEARWSDLFRGTADKLRSQLAWCDKFGCEYWTQDLYGQKSTYLDAVHGFVATALPLIRGRHLLGSDAWTGWSATIANTIRATATHENGMTSTRHSATACGTAGCSRDRLAAARRTETRASHEAVGVSRHVRARRQRNPAAVHRALSHAGCVARIASRLRPGRAGDGAEPRACARCAPVDVDDQPAAG